MTAAPERFVQWMTAHTANDKKHGRKVYRYHPRSDEHSKTLCRMVMEDLLAACPLLAEHAKARSIVGGINVEFTFANGKIKNLDRNRSDSRGDERRGGLAGATSDQGLAKIGQHVALL